MPDSRLAWSLQRRVGFISAVAMCTALTFGGLGMYWATSIDDSHRLDARLQELAGTILLLIDNELTETDLSAEAMQLHLQIGPRVNPLYSYQVWTPSGAQLLRSHEASATQPLMPLTALGFDTQSVRGEDSRTFAMSGRNGAVVIQVAEPLRERALHIGTVVGYYLLSLLLPFALVSLVIHLLLRRSFRALDSLAARLRHHNLLDVAPVHVLEPPRELMPIVRSVNALLARAARAISVEQRFTSVAAHELRTPLAGIRAQAQLACGVQTDEERQEALQAVIGGVDRAARVFDQLLDLTRVESLSSDVAANFQWIDLSAVHQQVMSELGDKARSKRLQLDVRFVDAKVHGLDFALYLLLRNLLANAILYSPTGGRVQLVVQPEADAIALTLDDAGPGIPAGARELAFERFNRLHQSRAEGVGLGLSIVAQAVELHHATIQLLDSALGGLRVQVLFPRHP